MPISTDVLNSTLADLYAKGGNIILATATRKPLIRKLLDPKRINKATIGGTYVEMPFGSGSPAKGTRINNGLEVAPLTRKNITQKYQIQTVRIYTPVVIPRKDLMANDGKLGVAKLIKQYPLATSEQLMEDWEYWYLTGAYHDTAISVIDTPGFDGFATLNGNVTASADFASNTGWCQMATKASQSGNVQGVARSQTLNHVNQYGLVTSFASDGLAVLRRVQSDVAAYGACDFGFADGVSFANIQSNMADNVRIDNLDDSVEGKMSHSYVQFGITRIYDMNINLDTTNASFNGTAASSSSSITGGCVYFCSSDYMEVPFREMTEAPTFDKLPGQDAVAGDMVFDANPMLEKLAAFGVAAGTRIP